MLEFNVGLDEYNVGIEAVEDAYDLYDEALIAEEDDDLWLMCTRLKSSISWFEVAVEQMDYADIDFTDAVPSCQQEGLSYETGEARRMRDTAREYSAEFSDFSGQLQDWVDQNCS